MDPPSPAKFPMSPGMPVFAVSPERVAGTKPPYSGPAPSSPSLPDLRSAPTRALSHRRNDSDVSVHGLAAMFENLEVKDFKDAQAKYMQALQKQKMKHAKEVADLENKHQQAFGRYEIRLEELKSELKRAREANENTIPKELWDKERQDHREAIKKWDSALKKENEKRKHTENIARELSTKYKAIKVAAESQSKKIKELFAEKQKAEGAIPTFTAKISSLERTVRLKESDLKFQTGEAEKYKNQVYGLQVELEGTIDRLGEEIQTLQDKLRLIEVERDALKTSLKEEEVLRIAAEGCIPLPGTTTEEHDEFASPVRSPRKQRTPDRDEEDKENVAPKKAVVELKLAQQELATEKRLRERAQDQIEFMKMECQFQCCSCRLADLKGTQYVRDDSFSAEMERIKASVPIMTPPASDHSDDPMEDIEIKQEPIDDESPSIPLVEPLQDGVVQDVDTSMFPEPPVSGLPEPVMAFSPTSGTFRSVPSPVKTAPSTLAATPATQSCLGLSSITEVVAESSPWTPDINNNVIRTEATSPPLCSMAQEPEEDVKEKEIVVKPESVSSNIIIHEDDVAESDEENSGPQTPLHSPPGPATPAQWLTRTITTTTTIPLHFSPMTPVTKTADHPLTPSTIAHAPSDAQSNILGEIALNKLPFDREAALEAIRQRRGRARSMAAGHGTPRKQMMEGLKERRDISAPVARVRR